MYLQKKYFSSLLVALYIRKILNFYQSPSSWLWQFGSPVSVCYQSPSSWLLMIGSPVCVCYQPHSSWLWLAALSVYATNLPLADYDRLAALSMCYQSPSNWLWQFGSSVCVLPISLQLTMTVWQPCMCTTNLPPADYDRLSS